MTYTTNEYLLGARRRIHSERFRLISFMYWYRNVLHHEKIPGPDKDIFKEYCSKVEAKKGWGPKELAAFLKENLPYQGSDVKFQDSGFGREEHVRALRVKKNTDFRILIEDINESYFQVAFFMGPGYQEGDKSDTLLYETLRFKWAPEKSIQIDYLDHDSYYWDGMVTLLNESNAVSNDCLHRSYLGGYTVKFHRMVAQFMIAQRESLNWGKIDEWLGVKV